jgi:hypothetical protein
MTDTNDGPANGRSSPPARRDIGRTTPPDTATAPHTPTTDCCLHPGIVVRPGPTGPRAALVGGPDVWEVIGAMHALREEDPVRHGDALHRELRTVTGLTTAQVTAALDYYTAHPQDVDTRIADNHEAAEQARRPPTAGDPPGRHPGT